MVARRHWLALVPLLVLTGCGDCGGPATQRSPLESPGGRYVLTMDKKEATGRDHPEYWFPEIRTGDGELVFSDMVGFPGPHELHWAWDSEQRVWVRDVDSDVVEVIEPTNDDGTGYLRHVWSGSRPCEGQDEACPPDVLFE